MAKVYVLGAGASKALNPNAPLMADLFSIGLKCLFADDSPCPDSIKRKLHAFLEDVYKCSYFPQNKGLLLPPIEDVISQIDYCLLNNKPLVNYTIEELRVLRSAIIFTIALAIQKSLGRGSDQTLVMRFVELISADDSIISLNYDLIVEGFLYPRTSNNVNYGFLPKNRRSVPSRIPPLLKLHGSLNWLYCPVCQQIKIYDFQKIIIAHLMEAKRCDKCNTSYEPVMITPSFLKDYSNPHIASIWFQAEQRLLQADEVIFVGYSMPDADIILRTLFSRAFYTNRKTRGSCRVTVVDLVEENKRTSKFPKSDAHRRYCQLFGDIEYHDDGFVNYIESHRPMDPPIIHRENKEP